MDGNARHQPDINTCTAEGLAEPHVFVIFGATGDLASRKVVPALAALALQGHLPRPFALVGASRTELSDEAFRTRLRQAMTEFRPQLLPQFEAMVEHTYYCHLHDYDDLASYQAMAKRLEEIDTSLRIGGNRIFYLAVPPSTYEAIGRNLGLAGLSLEAPPAPGHTRPSTFTRIVVEKPFGHDLTSARALDHTLHQHFDEPQVFRIDHYMAKETVQNVMMLRFANAIFEPIWNRQYISYVEITAAEALGVENRAGYYDKAGVLRDMFQNHMMQLLALCAMEPPPRFEAELVRDEKSKVFRALKPFPVDRLYDNLVLGQYGAGTVNGRAVPAYAEEPDVAPGSHTATYAMIKAQLDNWRWQGVPFYLMSGKRMREKRTEIVIHFKEVPCSLFRAMLGEHIATNSLTLGIYPQEVISMSLQTKVPGSKVCLRTVDLNFDYGSGATGPQFDGYETIILDVMLGDHTLFWREDAVELCWEYLTPILTQCEGQTCAMPVAVYPAGSHGPQEAAALLQS